MKTFNYLSGLLVCSCVAVMVGCSDTSTMPSSTSTATLTTDLLTSNEIPPVTGTEASASGTARLTFNLSKDSGGTITSATMDATVSATGLPPGTVLTASHIHTGATGTNGGILVSLGLTDGEVAFSNGGGSFTKRGIAVPVDQVNSILANPAGFYLNIHTVANAGGVARGQLTRVQ